MRKIELFGQETRVSKGYAYIYLFTHSTNIHDYSYMSKLLSSNREFLLFKRSQNANEGNQNL